MYHINTGVLSYIKEITKYTFLIWTIMYGSLIIALYCLVKIAH